MSRLKERLRDVPEDVRRFVSKQAELSAAVSDALAAKDGGNGWTQRRLAREMGKKESAISRLLQFSLPDAPAPEEATEGAVDRMLSGIGNPTLKTIVELEVALGCDLLVVPQFHKAETSSYDLSEAALDVVFERAVGPLAFPYSHLGYDDLEVPRASSLTIGRARHTTR